MASRPMGAKADFPDVMPAIAGGEPGITILILMLGWVFMKISVYLAKRGSMRSLPTTYMDPSGRRYEALLAGGSTGRGTYCFKPESVCASAAGIVGGTLHSATIITMAPRAAMAAWPERR